MLEANFSLVLLLERMDESLVLLARALYLPLHAVAAFRKNARKGGSKEAISHDQREILARFQAVDLAIYRHFRRRFQLAVEEFGTDRMARSVRELRNINRQVIDHFTSSG